MTDVDLHAPDGAPWCHFRAGLWCRNGDSCLNPNHWRPDHGGTEDPAVPPRG